MRNHSSHRFWHLDHNITGQVYMLRDITSQRGAISEACLYLAALHVPSGQ